MDALRKTFCTPRMRCRGEPFTALPYKATVQNRAFCGGGGLLISAAEDTNRGEKHVRCGGLLDNGVSAFYRIIPTSIASHSWLRASGTNIERIHESPVVPSAPFPCCRDVYVQRC